MVSSASAGSVVIQVLPSFFRPADPTAYLALQHDQLTPERGILCFKSALGLEERGNQLHEEEY